MDGLQNETKQIDEGAQQQVPQRDYQNEASQAQVSTPAPAGDAAERARADYEAALRESDAWIAELKGEIAEAAKTAEGAEALRKEMDELCRKGEEQRVGSSSRWPGRAA